MNAKLIARYALRSVLNLAGMGVGLFWPAGRLDWWPAWGALAVMAFWLAAMPIVSWRANPALLAEYLGPRKGGKSWDQAIIAALGLAQLIRYIAAGFDQRYEWTGGLPLAVQLVALAACFLGYLLFVWAAASNASFAQVNRLQGGAGQTVASGGPYRWVRHPAYSGALLYELAVSFLLASWPALAVSAATAALLVLRTALEDRALQAELPGYAGYAAQVRWRLLPGVW